MWCTIKCIISLPGERTIRPHSFSIIKFHFFHDDIPFTGTKPYTRLWVWNEKKIRTLGVGSRGKMSAFCLFRILADGQTGHQSSCNSATFSSKCAKKYYIISLTSVMSDFITSVREILCCHDNLINSVRSSCIVKGILLLTEVLYIRECNSFSSFYLTKAIFYYSWNTLCLKA